MYIDLFSRILLIVGCIPYLLNYFKYKINLQIINQIGLFIGISALYNMLNRDYYLPFLGKAVFPSLPVTPAPKLAENEKPVVVNLKNLPINTKVIFWASSSSDNTFPTPEEAYGKSTNFGITQTDTQGNVTFTISCPAAYSVNKFGVFEKVLKSHVHYRYELPKYKGLFSRVYTKKVEC